MVPGCGQRRVSRWWRSLGQGMEEAEATAEMATPSAKRVVDTPRSHVARACWAQRCQRYLGDIAIGTSIDQFKEGWCHTSCRYQAVRRAL